MGGRGEGAGKGLRARPAAAAAHGLLHAGACRLAAGSGRSRTQHVGGRWPRRRQPRGWRWCGAMKGASCRLPPWHPQRAAPQPGCRLRAASAARRLPGRGLGTHPRTRMRTCTRPPTPTYLQALITPSPKQPPPPLRPPPPPPPPPPLSPPHHGPQVQRDFEELPPEAVDSLRESLLQLLIRFSK